MKDQKCFTVKWEGTEPYHATKTQAITDLWLAHFLMVEASIYTPLDPGTTHAKNLRNSDFPNIPKPIQDAVLNNLREHYLESIGTWIESVNLGTERPKLVFVEGNDQKFLAVGAVECWCEVFFAMNHPRAKYSVGFSTGDDYVEVIDTMAHLEAAQRFCGLLAEQKAKETFSKATV